VAGEGSSRPWPNQQHPNSAAPSVLGDSAFTKVSLAADGAFPVCPQSMHVLDLHSLRSTFFHEAGHGVLAIFDGCRCDCIRFTPRADSSGRTIAEANTGPCASDLPDFQEAIRSVGSFLGAGPMPKARRNTLEPAGTNTGKPCRGR
jgi:hypothetical protein